MCKRFIDCGIWKQPWYLDLTSDQKVIWEYLTLHCDSAGLWKVEIYQLKRDTGIKDINFDEVLAAINRDYDGDEVIKVDRIIYLKERKKIWITGFISFQYEKGKNGVNAAIPAVKGAINRLRDEGILDYAIKNGFVRVNNYKNTDSRGSQPLATDKDKDKDQDSSSLFLNEEGGVGEETSPKFLTEQLFQEWWGTIPNPGELKISEEMHKEFGEEEFIFALKQSSEYKVKKMSYIRAILKQRREKAAAEKEKAEARKKQQELQEHIAEQRKQGIKLNLIEQVYGKQT
ncbi:MAG: hypothetical protein ACM3RX_05765 [Methanococcaceae archaeon]